MGFGFEITTLNFDLKFGFLFQDFNASPADLLLWWFLQKNLNFQVVGIGEDKHCRRFRLDLENFYPFGEDKTLEN